MTTRQQKEAADRARRDRRVQVRASNRGKRSMPPLIDPDWPKSALLAAVKSEFKLDIPTAANVVAPLFTPYPLSLVSLEKHGTTALRLIADFNSAPQIKAAGVRLSLAAEPRSAATALFRKHQLLASRMGDDEFKAMVSDIENIRQAFGSIRTGDAGGLASALAALCAKQHWLNMVKYLVKRAEDIIAPADGTSTPLALMIRTFVPIARRVILELDQNTPPGPTA